MSYQPQPLIPVPAPVAAPVAAPRKGKGRKVLGVLFIVAGLAAGGALVVLGLANTEETVKKFARAPAGCTTTLEFDETGEYTAYLETEGHVDDVEGDCLADGTAYSRADDDLPQVTLSLVGESGDELSLADADGPSYSEGGFTGTGIRTFTIDEVGGYALTVNSDDSDFAIAVGGDPEGDSQLLLLSGIGAAALGLIIGLLLLLLGRGGGATPAPTWQPAPQWPQQATVPGYQPTVPGYQATPQYPHQYPQQPTAPPAPPPGQGWGAPQQ